MNSSAKWFSAAEATGDFMGIRYGRKSDASGKVEWSFVSHIECDGIGGFGRLLRQNGAELIELPETRHPNRKIIKPLWNLMRQSAPSAERATREDWNLGETEEAIASESKAVAWHLFTEEETEQIRQKCRQMKVTVNSYLLKYLDQAVRVDIKNPDLAIAWMIPVNLRGDIRYADDTENHVSCVEPVISDVNSVEDIQRQIIHRLARGEHRAYHLILKIGALLTQKAKMHYITKSRKKSGGNIGAFSNLGVWDSEKTIESNDAWFFCPPVCKGQLLGAGCVTFKNRLSLTLQAHSDLSDQPERAKTWMKRWVAAI